MSTDIIHFVSKKLTYYKGDYDTFVNVRAEAAKNQRRAYEASMAKKQHMQEFIDKFRSNAKRASLVQSRIKVRLKPSTEAKYSVHPASLSRALVGKCLVISHALLVSKLVGVRLLRCLAGSG